MILRSQTQRLNSLQPPPPPPPPPAQEFAQDCQFPTSMAPQPSKPPWTSSDHRQILI
jgi:hypothetical protein